MQINKMVLGCTLLSACVVYADTLPENMRVYPTPQEVTLTSTTATATPAQMAIANIEQMDADTVAVLKTAFTVTKDAPFTVTWTVSDSTLPAEGYTLALEANGAKLAASSDRGLYYAAQTLTQLLATKTYQSCKIKDWPVVPFRGTVEGFYGQPWSFEARKSQFRFYGKYKMNAYVYGPKNDPFHGFGNKWRDPYPAEQAQQMRELVKVAHENKVNFIWAVHPGNNISWKDDADMKACVAKFQMMYDLGIRAFAVFFDDIGGEGARAEKQVELLNYINRNFVRIKGDVAPLLLCPTQYNRAWSGGPYLETLGKGLDSDINIMWTGNSVCCDITYESMQWINAKLGRKAYIWWNWPVSDYVRSHLLLGRAYGNASENGPLYAGFVSNPMDKPEASKIGLFGIADYTWNPKAYQSEQAWKDGIVRLFPECAPAVQIFADHNSDQGQNGHGYRREESVALQPLLQRVEASIKAGKAPAMQDLEALQQAFVEMATAVAEIKAKCQNTVFVSECKDWLAHFDELAKLGQAVCKALMTPQSTACALNQVLACQATMEQIIAQHRKPPYDLSVTTGSRVVRPFLDQVVPVLYARLYQQLTGRTLKICEAGKIEAISNVTMLANVPPRREGKFIHFGRVMEVLTLQPGEWFGLVLPDGICANYIHAKLNTPACAAQGEIQLSSDGGKTWRREATRNGGEEMQNALNLDRKINAGRYINTSDKPVEIKINLFKFDVPDGAKANVPETMIDGRLDSGYTLQPGQSVTLALPAPAPTQANVHVLADHQTVTVAYGANAVTLTNTAKDAAVTVYEIIH